MNEITRRYLEHLAVSRIRPAALTAAARASELLMAANRGRFLNRPAFLDADDAGNLAFDLSRLYDLLTSVPARLFDNDIKAYASNIGMNAVQIEAVQRLGADRLLRLGRADLYRERDGFKVLEVNLGSPLGGVENAELNRAMLASPVLSGFVAEEGLGYRDTLAGVAQTLLTYCQQSQVEARPVVAIVDAPHSFADLAPRFHALARRLGDHGIDAFACDASQVSLSGGRVVSDGRVIDVVYRWFILDDLRLGAYDIELFEPIFQAYENGQVSVFAPFDLELYGNKRALALLSDPRYRDAFTGQEGELVDRLLPWTRELSQSRTTVGGKEIDLVDYCREYRAELMLKPNLAYGGAGISPGWLMDDHAWCNALDEARRSHYVVQRRVRSVTEPFFDEVSGETVDTVLTWGVFLDADGYGGAYVRGCPDPDVGVVSMDTGAASGCCFSPSTGEPDDSARSK